MRQLYLNISDHNADIKVVRLENNEVWKLHGECNRCGVCCEKLKCEKLKYESQNGKRISVCTIRETRYWYCMLYPRDPYDPLPKECSFKWEKISG